VQCPQRNACGPSRSPEIGPTAFNSRERLWQRTILPGLIPVVLYRRRPSALRIGLRLISALFLSGLLGYVQETGTSRVKKIAIPATEGGVTLCVAVLAYLDS
jgi:hypothetical protein